MRELGLKATSPKEAIRKIAEQMLKLRPKAEVTYHPYRKNEIYRDEHLGLRRIDLKKLYPEAKPGNTVYIDTVIEACCEGEAKINFIGNAKVIYHGEVIFDSQKDASADGKCRCALYLSQGENPVRFLVRCDSEESFTFSFMPSVRWYWVWAKCYLLSARATSPIPCYKNEDGVGISRLFEGECPFDGVYAYPKAPVIENRIDFAAIFSDTQSDYAYALTYALRATELTIDARAPYTVYVNGERRDGALKLAEGDCVLLKMQNAEDFSFSFNAADIGIPFLDSKRGGSDKWLTLGGFREGGVCFTPEEQIQFKKPYLCDGKRLFWKLADKDDYMRPHLRSRFFAQWHYSFMVGTYGLLNASYAVDEEKYREYFIDNMRLMVEYFDYMRYEHEHFGSPSFIDVSATLHDLDSIGSMGRNFCLYYDLTGDERVLPVIDTLLLAMKTNIPRFEDGTYHRPRDMWADDTFMSCPFLVKAAKLTGNSAYYEEAVRQLLGFKRKLWMEDKSIFSHIYFLDKQRQNRVPWGRGNGWVFVSMSDALMNVPKQTPGYDELKESFVAFAKGIVALQDGDGLWHQVLDRHDSYSETSCTAMFALGFCRGISLGILPEEYKESIVRAYHAILNLKVDSEGCVYDVCMGSGNADNVEYYMNLGAVDNDDHGTGLILTTLSEIDKLNLI